ncbi:hypothetical protein [Flavobacterium phage FL-1]|nr:hypothetical protein [Flavobacterium phage FL-1]
MPEKVINSEFYQFFIKILFPAFLAVGLKIAIEMKKTKTKVSILNIFLSIIIGVGGAVLTSGAIQAYFSKDVGVPIVIGLVAILSEKIGEFIIYKLNVDIFLTAATEAFFDFILNLKNKK